jgi:predicted enzyme related to lactoylglutathione lyase
MSLRTSPWPIGVPCYADVSTPDLPGAQAFYADVLGWSYGEAAPGFEGYVVANVDGADTGGVGPQAPGEDGPGAWTVYFATDDIDHLAARIGELGGAVVVGPMPIGDAGRMLIATDPSGAQFGLWEAGQMIGASLTNAAGGLLWEDLRSTAPDLAREFYLGLFSYRYEPVEMAGPDYAVFVNPGEQAPLGGMGGMFGKEGPSFWEPYFGVADVDAAVAAAEARGASVTEPAHDSPFGRMAGLRDPWGAVFQVMEPGDERPDRSG